MTGSVGTDVALDLDTPCRLDPQVALRPEPFGALAYHYGNRRLIFLRHPDIVRVVEELGEGTPVRDALEAQQVDESRWPSFVAALSSLADSGIVRVV